MTNILHQKFRQTDYCATKTISQKTPNCVQPDFTCCLLNTDSLDPSHTPLTGSPGERLRNLHSKHIPAMTLMSSKG